MRRRHSFAALAAVLICAVAGVACGSDEGADSGQPPENQAYRGICRAVAAVKADDLDEARRIFDDEAHGPLHDLSAEVDDEDREVAGRLLEGKQAVEEAIGKKEGADVLGPALEDLAAATADAVTEVEGEPGPCPG